MAKLEVNSDSELSTDEAEMVFNQAAEWIRSNRSLKLSTDQKLSLYGLFKQGSEGSCTTAKPGIFDMTGRAKWEAWHKLGAMAAVEAMTEYVNLVRNLAPHWKEVPCSMKDGASNKGSGGGGGKGGGGPIVSTLMSNAEEVIPDENKSAFDWCKEGHVTKLASVVVETNVNMLDEQGMSLLHWACDRGHLKVVKWLVATGADVNQQDQDLQTPLHYAVSCGHKEVVELLASIPTINKDMSDCDGARPAEVTSDPSIRAILSLQ